MIYLDNAATTRVFDCATEAATVAMRELYFNPNATYGSGIAARDGIESARAVIASAVGAKQSEIVFTSCATESNNWVFEYGVKNKKGNIVISAGEHSSIYEPAMRLKNRGADIRIVPLDKTGRVDERAFTELADENTALVSVIHVNNETGVINPIKKLADIVKSRAPRALFHSDGVQGFLKTGDTLSGLGVDFYSASAHKLGAPKGIGLLYVRHGVNISPMICGGGQERGLRSGTQNTPYIAAFASAVERFDKVSDREKIAALRNNLCRIFKDAGCKIIGEQNNSGYILCVCISKAKAEILQNMVFDRGVIIGKGAACSGSKRGNRVLSAMGLCSSEIECCIRLSFFVDTDYTDAEIAAKIIIDAANKLRSGNVG